MRQYYLDLPLAPAKAYHSPQVDCTSGPLLRPARYFSNEKVVSVVDWLYRIDHLGSDLRQCDLRRCLSEISSLWQRGNTGFPAVTCSGNIESEPDVYHLVVELHPLIFGWIAPQLDVRYKVRHARLSSSGALIVRLELRCGHQLFANPQSSGIKNATPCRVHCRLAA